MCVVKCTEATAIMGRFPSSRGILDFLTVELLWFSKFARGVGEFLIHIVPLLELGDRC